MAYEVGGRTDKVILEDEKHIRTFVHRGIFAFKEIKAGELLNTDNMVVLRPGNCENGIAPHFFDMLIRKKARANKDILENQPIRWDDVIYL